MASSFMQYLNINTVVTPAAGTSTTSKQVLLFGQRLTNGTLYPPAVGFNYPNYYIPFQLPAFPNGAAALQYLANYGIQYEMGYNYNTTFPAPDIVNILSSANSQLIWNVPPANFYTLTGFNLSGTISQGLANAPMITATINVSGQAVLTVTGNPAFIVSGSSGGTMTVAAYDNIPYPNPKTSDPIALMVWDFYQTALSANQSANGVPTAYISILSDRDRSINSVSTPVALPAPTSVQITSSLTTLVFDFTSLSQLTNFGYIPVFGSNGSTPGYGNTVITQATSLATGVLSGCVIDSGAGLAYITLVNVTGTFLAADTLSMVIDDTINAFNYLDNVNLYGAVLQFPIDTLDNITINQASFFQGIQQLNQPSEVLLQHYWTYGFAGNVTILPSLVTTLPSSNSPEYILVSYPIVQGINTIPYDNATQTVASGRVAAATAYMLANGDAPYPPLMGTTISQFPINTAPNTTYSMSQFGSGNQAVIQGWLPIGVNSQGVAQLLESNTTLITDPGTGVPDIEFRFTHIWDCVRWIKQQVAQLYQAISVLPNNQGSALLSPYFIRQFRTGIIGILYTAQSRGIVENVSAYEGLVSVIQDPVTPTQVDAYIPCQIIPQLNGANVTINVFSSLFQFNNTNTQGV